MFNFFKIVPIKSYQYKGHITAYCSNSKWRVLCHVDGEVQVFLRDWDCASLKAKDLKFCCIPENSDNLYLLSQHALTNKIYLNVYSISTQSNRKSASLISTSSIASNSIVTALSAFHISEFQQYLAIGLENGSILFFKSALQKEIPSNSFKSFIITTKPIKGIAFSKNGDNINMFVCSNAGIFCFTISASSKLLETKISLDDMDYPIHCVTFKPSYESTGEQYLIVARENGLYCYTAEGRGPCYAISGNKQTVEWFGKYLIILINISCSNTGNKKSQVLIYDTENKIIVLDKQLAEVASLLPVANHTNCLLILKTGEAYMLKEKELRYKLSCVIRKNLFDLAIKLFEESKVDIDVSDILIQYGDFVLQRGDALGAVDVYAKTIGKVPTFSVIKKLKDFRYNDVLIQYLSRLVQSDFKIPEHSVLLNSCVRRINLPRSTFRLFEIDDDEHQKQYIYFGTVNHNLNVTLIINYLKQENYFSPYFFYEYSDTEVIKFSSECGYYLIKEHPNGFKELTKHSLSDLALSKIFQQILLPLSLMNKLCAHYFIDHLLDRSEESTYNILTELILKGWQNGDIDPKFVIDYLKSNQMEIGNDNVFVLCRHYNFWPGIKMIYDYRRLDALSNHCLTKCLEIFPEYVNLCSEKLSFKLNQMMLQTLKKQSLSEIYTLKYITGIAKNIISFNPNYILNLLSSFSNSEDFLISHLDDFLVQDFFSTNFKCDELNTIVSLLETRVLCIEQVLQNYLRRPIEFRNRSCDICKLVLKQPSVYFLCQHSFHRECLFQLNEDFLCNICLDKQNFSKEADVPARLEAKTYDEHITNNMLTVISKRIGKIPFKTSKNPFTFTSKSPPSVEPLFNQIGNKTPINFINREYDDNLNPFIGK